MKPIRNLYRGMAIISKKLDQHRSMEQLTRAADVLDPLADDFNAFRDYCQARKERQRLLQEADLNPPAEQVTRPVPETPQALGRHALQSRQVRQQVRIRQSQRSTSVYRHGEPWCIGLSPLVPNPWPESATSPLSGWPAFVRRV